MPVITYKKVLQMMKDLGFFELYSEERGYGKEWTIPDELKRLENCPEEANIPVVWKAKMYRESRDRIRPERIYVYEVSDSGRIYPDDGAYVHASCLLGDCIKTFDELEKIDR